MENLHFKTYTAVICYKGLMKSLVKVLIFACLILSPNLKAQTCPTGRSDYFCLTPEMAPDSVIQIYDFYNVPVKIISLFYPEISKLKYPLVLEAKWESPYFGAGISLYQEQYRLMILGGMTRIEKMTLDAYAAIVCHELGHMLGGAPFQTMPGSEWSSAEGQSDFFAASVCLPRFYKAQNISEGEIEKKVEKAGFEMMDALKDFDSNEPDAVLVRNLDYKIIAPSTLINNYPTIQCRYETFRNSNDKAACWFKK